MALMPSRSRRSTVEATVCRERSSQPCAPGTATKLPRWKRRVGDRSDKVGGRSLRGEPNDRTVDVDAGGAVRSGLTGGRVNARQQVGPGGRQVEDDVLIDLALVESRAHRLGGPQAELRVP